MPERLSGGQDRFYVTSKTKQSAGGSETLYSKVKSPSPLERRVKKILTSLETVVLSIIVSSGGCVAQICTARTLYLSLVL